MYGDAYSTVEVTVGVICCCMPIIPAVARSVIDSKMWFSMTSHLQHWTQKRSQEPILEQTKATPIAAGARNGSWAEMGLNKKPPTSERGRHYNNTQVQPLQTHRQLGMNPSYIELESLDDR